MNDEELVREIARVAGKIEYDFVRLKRPLSEKDAENSQYWIDRRCPQLVKLCEEFLAREDKRK